MYQPSTGVKLENLTGMITIALFFFLLTLEKIQPILLLVLTAVILANALNVLVKKLQESANFCARKAQLPYWQLQRKWAIIGTFIIVNFIIWLFFAIIFPPFIPQFQQLAERVPEGFQELTTRIDAWIYFLDQRFDINIGEFVPDVNQLLQEIPRNIDNLVDRGLDFFSDSLLVALNILFLLVLTVMFLVDPLPYRRGFIRLFPRFYRPRVDQVLDLCDEALQGWLMGILFNMLCIGVLSFIGLSLLGLPLVLAQSALAGLLTFIPNIGPGLSVIPPITIALLEEPWKAIAVLILYVVIQQVESNFLTPYVMAQQVSLLPVITLISQVVFASLFGFIGLFLALPLIVIIQVLVRELVIKDIFDAWQTKYGQQLAIALAPPPDPETPPLAPVIHPTDHHPTDDPSL